MLPSVHYGYCMYGHNWYHVSYLITYSSTVINIQTMGGITIRAAGPNSASRSTVINWHVDLVYTIHRVTFSITATEYSKHCKLLFKQADLASNHALYGLCSRQSK